jgi:hypothetical protein
VNSEKRVMDEILIRLAETNWAYGDKDGAALAILEQRIAEAGRRQEFVTYSDLVKGVEFHLPQVRGGEAYRIFEWTGLDRAIIGDFLGYISDRSYREAGFMSSCLVVNIEDHQPSKGFFEWMKKLGALKGASDPLAFWTEQVKKAHEWYQSH